MSAREWKPGDVAWVTGPNGEGEVGYFDGREWRWQFGGHAAAIGEGLLASARPLAVVDPEDFGPCALMNLVTPHFLPGKHLNKSPDGFGERVHAATDALREGLRDWGPPEDYDTRRTVQRLLREQKRDAS